MSKDHKKIDEDKSAEIKKAAEIIADIALGLKEIPTNEGAMVVRKEIQERLQSLGINPQKIKSLRDGLSAYLDSEKED